MGEHKLIKIGITQGDLNGVGSEVIIKALFDGRMCEMFTPVIYGSSKALTFYKKCVEEGEQFSINTVASGKDALPKRINLVECVSEDVHIEPGVATRESGAAAVAALKAAVADIKSGAIQALVTAPINKETVHGDDFNFTGHTEFLAGEFGGEPLMVMCSDILKVGLVTIHIPVTKVGAELSQEKIVKHAVALRNMLMSDFGVVKPKLAVLALNPHAGDGGLLGNEEKEMIKPAIIEANKHGVLAFGPFAADGFFASGAYSKYDAVLAMYHDQGLTPFKTLSPCGVNVTGCLSVVRTSPDHGVAYDIAGRGVADEQSMRNAIYMAIDIYRNRRLAEERTANPLRHFEREKGRDVSVADLPETDI